MNYYNGADVLNSGCPFNFVLSNRTAGKTFYWSRYCVNNFIKNGEKFIYIRRNENDLDNSCPDFFKDISNKFPGIGYRYKSHRMYFGTIDKEGEFIEEPRLGGYAFSLSTVKKLKSVPLSDVTTIFYDEFLPDDMRFLHPSEVTFEPNMLMSIYLTVARGYKQVIRDNVRLIACANVVSRFNPYFSVFGIDLSRQNKYKSKSVYARILYNKEVADALRASKIGEILERTSYGQYALDNIPLADVNSNIEKHEKRDRAYCNINFFGEWFICYFSVRLDSIIIGSGYDETLKRKYKIDDVEGLSEVPYFTGEILKMFKELAKKSKIKYESMDIKVKLAGFIQPTIQRS